MDLNYLLLTHKMPQIKNLAVFNILRNLSSKHLIVVKPGRKRFVVDVKERKTGDGYVIRALLL